MITRALALAAFLVSQVTEGGAMITEHNVGAHDLDAGKLYGDFSADPNTYLWRSAADEWTVVSGGVNVLVCDALGCSVVGNLNLNGNDILNLDDAYSAASTSAAVAARVTTIGTQGPINQAARPAQDDGANLVLAPASAWKGITGVTRAAVSEGATVTLTIQAEGVVSTCVKTEGAGAGGTFECNGAASDDACVTNLKATYTATPCVGVTVSAVAGETMGFTNTPGTASRIALAVSDTDIAIATGTDGAVLVSGRVYNPGGPLNLGGAVTTTHSAGANDAIVGGVLEVDGVSFFDNVTYHYSGISLPNSSAVYATVNQNNGIFFPLNLAQTPDAGLYGMSTSSNVFLFIESGDVAVDFAKSIQTNPTVCVQSADQTTTTDRICIAHNQTDGVLSTDGGNLNIVPTGGYAKVANAASTGGAWQSYPQTITCTDDAAGTHSTVGCTGIVISSNVVRLVCEDAHGCTLTLAETNWSATAAGHITLIGPAANHTDVADSAGVTELAGGVAMAMAALDSLTLVYAPAATTWVEVARADN